MENSPTGVVRCIHGMIPQTCIFCKDKPEYRGGETDAVKIIHRRYIGDNAERKASLQKERGLPDQNNQKEQEEKPMKKERQKCLICGDWHESRGLCSKHYQQWRAGKIEHPELGPWPQKKKEEDPPAPVPEIIKEDKVGVDGNLKFIGSNILEYGPVFSAIRKRLREIEALGLALTVLGKGDQVKKEIALFAKKFE